MNVKTLIYKNGKFLKEEYREIEIINYPKQKQLNNSKLLALLKSKLALTDQNIEALYDELNY